MEILDRLIEIFELFIDLILRLIWPAGTIIFIVLYFNKQIVGLFKRVSKIKVLDVEGEFLGEGKPSEPDQLAETQIVQIDAKLKKKIDDADFTSVIAEHNWKIPS